MEHADKWFVYTCARYGEDIKLPEWIYSLDVVSDKAKNEAFSYAILYGSVRLLKWLHSLGGVDIHVDNDRVFRETFMIAPLRPHTDNLKIRRWCREIEPSYDWDQLESKERQKQVSYISEFFNE